MSISDTANFYLCVNSEPNEENIKLLQYIKKNIKELNKKGIKIFVQCFDIKKIKKEVKKDLANKGIKSLPALFDNSTGEVIIGIANIITIFKKIVEHKKKKIPKNDRLADPDEDDFDNMALELVKEMEHEEDDREKILQETSMRQKMLASKLTPKRQQANNGRMDSYDKGSQYEEDDDHDDNYDNYRKSPTQEARIVNPSNRPSASAPPPKSMNKKMDNDATNFKVREKPPKNHDMSSDNDIDDELMMKLGLAED